MQRGARGREGLLGWFWGSECLEPATHRLEQDNWEVS